MENTINFIVNGVCTSSVVIIGCVLNSIAINIVRKNYDRTNIFYQMLIYLLGLDICVLLTWMNLSLFVAFGFTHTVIIHMLPYFSYPSTHIAITASTFMTVAIAHERYRAVRHPLKYNEGMKSTKATTKRLRKYVAFVIVISVGINIPHFMDLEVSYIQIKPTNKTDNSTTIMNTTNIAILNISSTDINNINLTNSIHINRVDQGIESENISDANLVARINYTTQGRHPYYLKWYRNFARLIVSGILPFSLLIYFNTAIYMAIKKTNNRRRRLSSNSHKTYQQKMPLKESKDMQSTISGTEDKQTSTTNAVGCVRRKSLLKKKKDEDNLSMVFVVIVTSFLMCHSLKFFLNFYDGFFGEVNATSGSRIAGCFSNFLVVLNSSLNTVIYCIMNAKFRKHFLNVTKNMISSFCGLLCCKCVSKNKHEEQPTKLKMISSLSKRSKCENISRGSNVARQDPNNRCIEMNNVLVTTCDGNGAF